MPRLNHGTLLENLIVLEVTRVLAMAPKATVEFACAFAMPPLTQCWHRTTHESGNNPRFNAKVMASLLKGALQIGPPTSYSALLLDCLQNQSNLPVVPYAMPDAGHSLEFGGPNGALLAAMLMRRRGQSLRIWSNDLADHGARYRGAPTPNAATECPRTSAYADALSAGNGGVPGTDAFCDMEFPRSIPVMAAWCRQCTVRIGFLDPDSYVAAGVSGPGQIDRLAHSLWLANLHRNAAHAAGIMFFASQNAPSRPTLIAAFHDDARDDYQHSVVFRHGNFMVGVKLRDHNEDPMSRIIDAVRHSWSEWSAMVGRNPDGLSWYVDCQHERRL